jgi:hypothetical protein
MFDDVWGRTPLFAGLGWLGLATEDAFRQICWTSQSVDPQAARTYPDEGLDKDTPHTEIWEMLYEMDLQLVGFLPAKVWLVAKKRPEHAVGVDGHTIGLQHLDEKEAIIKYRESSILRSSDFSSANIR